MEIVSNVSGIVISNISGFVLVIIAIAFIAISILLPVWAYLAKRYAHDCRQELREIKELFQAIQVENRLKDQLDRNKRS